MSEFDRLKEQKDRIIARQNDPVAILFRGSSEYERRQVQGRPPYIFVDHHRQPVFQPDAFQPDAVVTCYRETFKRNSEFCCPNCRCEIYNSIDYMTLPPWCLATSMREKL